jgi:hypothetical protein
MKTQALLLLPLLALAPACQTGPKRIDPGGDEAVTSAGVDYNEIIEWTDRLTQKMLASGFLDTGEFGAKPVKMVVSQIQNKTDLAHFPHELLLGKIRTGLLQSGKARFVTTYGADGTDQITRDTQGLKDDPLFDSSQVPKSGQATVARLGLATEVIWTYSQGLKEAQNTYIVLMYVTDVTNGEEVWRGESDPIAKVYEKGSVSW